MSKNLILLHGALGNKAHLQNLCDVLSPHYKVYTLDFPGHGAHFSSKDFSMEFFAEEVIAFMNRNSLESASIFGYSMGGYVGLKLAMQFPERVEKLITLGTKLKWNKEIAAKELQMLNTEKMERKIPQFVEKLKNENPASEWKELVNKTAKMLHGLGNGKALSEMEFKNIEIPVLVLRGSEDSMVTKEECENLVRILPDGTYFEIPGAMHQFEKVDDLKLKDIIIKFVG
ncbi:MAG TPA: alpha/beta hydrolase [Flavobacteriaceae bacterium]|nr:alpha/beta hydrolase [Flavobacteriaceae bacterium]